MIEYQARYPDPVFLELNEGETPFDLFKPPDFLQRLRVLLKNLVNF